MDVQWQVHAAHQGVSDPRLGRLGYKYWLKWQNLVAFNFKSPRMHATQNFPKQEMPGIKHNCYALEVITSPNVEYVSSWPPTTPGGSCRWWVWRAL